MAGSSCDVQAGSEDTEGLPEGSVFWELWVCMDYHSGEASASTLASPLAGLQLFPLSIALTYSDLLEIHGPFVSHHLRANRLSPVHCTVP